MESQGRYNLESSFPQILTNSLVGSDEKVTAWFSSAKGYNSGRIELHFKSPPKYRLMSCTTLNVFPTELPSETEKIWQITKTTASGSPRVVITCNSKEVLNLVLSDSVCTSPSASDWSTIWSGEMDRMQISSSDTASDYFRLGKWSYGVCY